MGGEGRSATRDVPRVKRRREKNTECAGCRKGLVFEPGANSLGEIYGLQMVYKSPENGSITKVFQPLLRE